MQNNSRKWRQTQNKMTYKITTKQSNDYDNIDTCPLFEAARGSPNFPWWVMIYRGLYGERPPRRDRRLYIMRCLRGSALVMG